MKLYESELRILNFLWSNGKSKAADIAAAMNTEYGWNKNTSYTVIKRCISKQLITRSEPGYICTAAISKRKAASIELSEILDNYFDGAVIRLFYLLLEISSVSKMEMKEMRKILKKRLS